MGEELKPCPHTTTRWQKTGDGRPVEFCPECGRNVSLGYLSDAAALPPAPQVAGVMPEKE